VFLIQNKAKALSVEGLIRQGQTGCSIWQMTEGR